MPKIVDHEERKIEIVEATWKVIEKMGIAEVTTRRIAKESGYSIGVLTHYFDNKDDILSAALNVLYQQNIERCKEHLNTYESLESLWAILCEQIPLTKRTLLESKVTIAFSGIALGNPKLSKCFKDSDDEWHGNTKKLIENLQKTKLVSSANNADEMTSEIITHLYGLGVIAIHNPRRYPPIYLKESLYKKLISLNIKAEKIDFDILPKAYQLPFK